MDGCLIGKNQLTNMVKIKICKIYIKIQIVQDKNNTKKKEIVLKLNCV